jgi:thiol-disulfide isomerase/thioredoxin
MKRIEMLRNAALLSWAFLMVTPAYALEVGEKSPDIQLQGQVAPVKLSESAGKLVYLDFWASWCGPCRQSFPWMNEMQAKYGPQGLQIIGVNLDARQEDAQKFLSQHPAAFTLAFDPKGDTPRQFGVKGMPTSFLIGRDGTILGSHVGFKETDRAKLEQQIEAALKAQP